MRCLALICAEILWQSVGAGDSSTSKQTKACQVDSALARMQRMTYDDRRSGYSAMLARLSHIEDVEDDYVAEYFFERGGANAVAFRDGAYLEALDNHKLDGGFANMVCGSYRHTLRYTFAREAYGDPARRRFLARCTGSTDLDESVAVAGEAERSPPGFGACAVDNVLLGPRPKAAEARRLVGEIAKLDPDRNWHLIGYVAFRLRENATRQAAKLVFRTVERALFASRPSPSICLLITRHEIEDPVCEMLQRRQGVPRACLGSDVDRETVERLRRCAAVKEVSRNGR